MSIYGLISYNTYFCALLNPPIELYDESDTIEKKCVFSQLPQIKQVDEIRFRFEDRNFNCQRKLSSIFKGKFIIVFYLCREV